MPVSATIRSSMDTRIAIAVRPNSARATGFSVDAVIEFRGTEFDCCLAGNAKPFSGLERVPHRDSVCAAQRLERDPVPARDPDQRLARSHFVSRKPAAV